MDEGSPGAEDRSSLLTRQGARDVLHRSPFAAWWGVDVLDVGAGWAELTLPWQPHFLRSGAVLQGACCMMLGDVATWLAMMTAIDGAETAVTLEMKTNFLGPGLGDLRCVGRVIKAGRRTVFCEASTGGATGKQVAFHTITYLMK